jgi:hypothetical protein
MMTPILPVTKGGEEEGGRGRYHTGAYMELIRENSSHF